MRPRQWPWYVLQVGVAASIFAWLVEYRPTDNSYLGAGMMFGGAYLATISLRGLIDLYSRLTALVGKQNQTPEDVHRIAAARRHLSDLRKTNPRLSVSQKSSNLLNPPT
jgi:hypothetical protein